MRCPIRPAPAGPPFDVAKRSAGTAAYFVLLAAATPALAQSAGQPPTRVENWISLQRNENGSAQWKAEPRLYLPIGQRGGWEFTQRIDAPFVYTDEKGTANPAGAWSFGFGNMLAEEIALSPEVAAGLRLRGSVRLVFPTGKAAPFGSSQYQWAPGAGAVYRRPDLWRGVTLEPYVRYFSGFATTEPEVKEVRQWDFYPTASFVISGPWSLQVYPENPIRYNRQNSSWFVPVDLMLNYQASRRWLFGLGGAYVVGDPRDPPYRYVVDARLTLVF